MPKDPFKRKKKTLPGAFLRVCSGLGRRPSVGARRFSRCPTSGTQVGQFTQGSVQIELIFRLLLKITVDWPFHAISLFLKPARAPLEEEKKIIYLYMRGEKFCILCLGACSRRMAVPSELRWQSGRLLTDRS